MHLDAQVQGDDVLKSPNWQRFIEYVNTEPSLRSAQRCIVQRRQKNPETSDQDFLSFHWVREDGKQTQGVSLPITYFTTQLFETFAVKLKALLDMPVLDPRCYSCTKEVAEVRKLVHGPRTNICDACLGPLIKARNGEELAEVTVGSHCLFCGRTSVQIESIYSLTRAATYMGICKECLMALEKVIA